MHNYCTVFKLRDPYHEGPISKDNWESGFAGEMQMMPSLFFPFILTNWFYLSWNVCIEQCNSNTLAYETWHDSHLVITSTLEANYYDISDWCPELWPKYTRSDYWCRCPPWYLLQITEKEYKQWAYSERYVGGDFGNLGFLHSIGIQHRNTVMRW